MGAKGKQKTGGRQKGTPNRSSVPVAQKAEELGIDPFVILLHFAAGNWKALGYAEEQYVSNINEYGTYYKWTIDPSVRSKAAQEACSYLYPKRKALELTGEEGQGFVIKIEDYTKK